MNKLIETMIVMLIVQACGAYAVDPSLQLCNKALVTCQSYAAEEDNYIVMLKKQEAVLESRLAWENDRLPWWAWGAIGFIAGGLTYTGINALEHR